VVVKSDSRLKENQIDLNGEGRRREIDEVGCCVAKDLEMVR